MLRHRTLSQSKFLQAVGLDCLAAYAGARGLSAPSSITDEEIDHWLAALDESDRDEVTDDWSTINDVADHAIVRMFASESGPCEHVGGWDDDVTGGRDDHCRMHERNLVNGLCPVEHARRALSPSTEALTTPSEEK